MSANGTHFKSARAAQLLLRAAVLFGLAAAVPGEESVQWIKTGPDCALQFPDRKLTFEAGDRVRLYRETESHYIGYVPAGRGSGFCAVPRKASSGEGTAWATADRELIFARQVDTEALMLPVAPDLVLAVRRANKAGYWISFEDPAFDFELLARRGDRTFSVIETGADALPGKLVLGANGVLHLVAAAPVVAPPRPAPRLEPVRSPAKPVVEESAPAPGFTLGDYFSWDDVKRVFVAMSLQLSKHSMMLAILLATLLVEGFFVVQLRQRTGRTAAGPDVQVAVAPPPVRAPALRNQTLAEAPNNALSGSLAGLPLDQVIQMLHQGGETGELIVESEDGLRADRLFFEEGRIVSARAEGLEGEDAAMLVLRRHRGQFRFAKYKVFSGKRSVQQSTMTLLLDAHREIDEKGWSD